MNIIKYFLNRNGSTQLRLYFCEIQINVPVAVSVFFFCFDNEGLAM